MGLGGLLNKSPLLIMLPPRSDIQDSRMPRFLFQMPRVVCDQKAKFESEELFKRLSRESEVRYTGYRERPAEERRAKFRNTCREGRTEVAFVNTGTNLQLMFNPCADGYSDECDFDAEPGKVHIRSSFIMNGVSVRWRGWIDLEKLDGVGCLEFDERLAKVEDALLRQHMEKCDQRLREFKDKHTFIPPRMFRLHNQEHAVEVTSRSAGSSDS